MKLENGVYRISDNKTKTNSGRIKILDRSSPEGKKVSELFPSSTEFLINVDNLDDHIQVCKVDLTQERPVDCKVIKTG